MMNVIEKVLAFILSVCVVAVFILLSPIIAAILVGGMLGLVIHETINIFKKDKEEEKQEEAIENLEEKLQIIEHVQETLKQ